MLFSGSSHPELATEIADSLGTTLGDVQIETFPDGEIGVQILENVRGRDVFVVQSIAKQPNFYLMELLILIDALKRASARSIVAVIPYYGYARQDRKDRGRVPITARLVANLLETAGVTRVVTMDLHTEQIQGFFNVPVDHLYARPVLQEVLKKEQLKNPVIVAPDIGSIKYSRILASELGFDFAIVDKMRMSSSQVEAMTLIGSVQGRDVILVDDICSTGETLKNGARVCKHAGANCVIAAVTHGVCEVDSVLDSDLDKLFITNTIPFPHESGHPKFVQVSVAKQFGKAIDLIIQNESVSALSRPAT